MATIQVLGNLTRDPEVREAGSSQVCSLRLAENTFSRGEKTTIYYEASVWGKRAETAARYLFKGSSVLVTGTFGTREYEHNGESRVSLEIANADFQFGSSKSDSSESPDDNSDDNSDSSLPF